jgi:hypothetical protein
VGAASQGWFGLFQLGLIAQKADKSKLARKGHTRTRFTQMLSRLYQMIDKLNNEPTQVDRIPLGTMGQSYAPSVDRCGVGYFKTQHIVLLIISSCFG